GHGLRIRDLAVARALTVGSAGRTVARELEPEQQSLARDLSDPVDPGQLGLQPVADFGHLVEEVLLLDGLEHGESGRAGDRVAAEGRAELAGLEQLRVRIYHSDGRPDGHDNAEALRRGDDVRGHAHTD